MKRILSLVLSLVMVLGITASTPVVSTAASVDDLVFELNYRGESYCVADCNESASGTIVIPATYDGKPVTKIDRWAFSQCDNLTSIVVSAGIEEIGYGAFSFCDNLQTVSLPDTVSVIGSNVFHYSKELTSINVDSGNPYFVSVGGVLYNKDKTNLICYPANKKDSSYTVPSTVEIIAQDAFACAESLVFVTLPEGLKIISDSAFSDCESLISVSIPYGVTTIGEKAFEQCGSLESVTISSSVADIGDMAFWLCDNLKYIDVDKNSSSFLSENGVLFDIDKTRLILYPAKKTGEAYTIPESVTVIENVAFHCAENLVSVTLPDSVTNIGKWAFSHCSSIESLDIPYGVQSIEYSTFSDCYNLKSVTIPDTVTNIEDGAFSYCQSLETVNISANVTNIGEGCFSWCSNLRYIDVDEGNEFYLSEDGVLFDINKTTLIRYPVGKEGQHYVIPDGVTTIAYGAFSRMKIWFMVTVPVSVTFIDSFAFSNNNYNCCGIFYPGSEYEWDNIEKGSYSHVDEVKIHYNSTWHTEVRESAVEPTCTTAGREEWVYCSVCYMTISGGAYIPATGHKSDEWIIGKEATCTEKGSKYKICEVCNSQFSYTIIPSTGHTIVTDPAVQQNCTTDGKTEGSHCSVCNAVIKAQEITPATGHVSSNWIIESQPDCATAGAKYKQCTVCGDELERETLPATGHKASNWIIENQATCETDGSKYRQCTVCGEVIERVAIPATGHTPSGWITNPQTSTQYKECTVCKQVIETQSVPVNAPTITSCYNEVEGVQLKWTAVANAAEYELYRKLPSQSGWTLLTTTSDLAYRDVDVTGNSVYQYSLKTIDVYGNKSGLSAQRECRFLETPTLLTRENAVGGVKITWEKVEGATSYRIYRRGAGTDYWFYLGDFPATINTFTDLETANYFPENPTKNQQAKPKSGNYYRYTIRASYDGEDSNGNPYLIYSGFDTVGLYLKYVATPKLTSISNATNGLQIKWTAVNGGGDTEYRVYRRGAGATYWYYLGTTTGTTWTDTKIANANGSYYRYTVRAVAGKDGSGWYSAFDTAGLYLMRLSNPTLNSAVSSSAGITVKWGSVKGATSYYVYRKTANSGWTRIATVSGNTNTTYLDKTAQKGVTYTYTVRAVYGATLSYFNSGISCMDLY